MAKDVPKVVQSAVQAGLLTELAVAPPTAQSPLLAALSTGRHTRTPQLVLELGLAFMGMRLSPEQARSAIRAVMRVLHPDIEEGDEAGQYRIPSLTQLRKWRRILKPLCRAVALRALQRRDVTEFYLTHDATGKCNTSTMGASVRLVAADGKHQDMPLDMALPVNSEAKSEAASVVGMLKPDFQLPTIKVAAAPLKKMAGLVSDKAPTAKVMSDELVDHKAVTVRAEDGFDDLSEAEQEAIWCAARCSRGRGAVHQGRRRGRDVARARDDRGRAGLRGRAATAGSRGSTGEDEEED